MNTCWIRVDASKQIGTGHIYRCLSIAEQIKHRYQVVFISRLFDGHLMDVIHQRGFEVIALAEDLSEWSEVAVHQTNDHPKVLKHSHWLQATQTEDALATYHALKARLVQTGDKLLVDHFALDAEWEGYIQSQLGLPVVVIDGQADRVHAAQVVVDPTVCAKSNKWRNMLAEGISLYKGAGYIPLSSAFFKLQKQVQLRSRLSTILIAFGGVDIQDFTGVALQALLEMPLQGVQIKVVVGQNYPNLLTLKSCCEQFDHINCFVQTTHMAELMLQADLAIGAGGSMAWERCLLGLPTLAAVIADNQREQVACLVSKGVARSIGDQVENVGPEIQAAIEAFQQTPHSLTTMSEAAMTLMDEASNHQWLTIFESM